MLPTTTSSGAAGPPPAPTGLTRRRLLGRGAALAVAAGAAPLLASCTGGDPGAQPNGSGPQAADGGGVRLAGRPASDDGWWEPDVRASRDGLLRTRLRASTKAVEIAGRRITTQVYEGSYPGPTLRVRPGDRLEIELVNDLAEPTNLHTHGLHVSPDEPADDVLITVPAGGRYTYRYDIPADHPTGTYWYHPHLHGYSGDQNFAGLFGTLVVEGELDELPGVAGRPERLFVLAQTQLTPEGTVVSEAVSSLGDEITLVNGRSRPVLPGRPGEIQRWRVVNAGTVFHRLELTGARWWAIAVDGNPMVAPTPQRVPILPQGGRLDLLVQLPESGTVELRSLPWTEYGDRYTKGMVPQFGATLTEVRVGGARADGLSVPAVLLPVEDLRDRPVDRRRTITLTEIQPSGDPNLADFHYQLDGRDFDHDRVDQTMTLGALEEWTFVNDTDEPHPMHIHVNPFQVVAVSGMPVDECWKRDTAMVPPRGSLTIRHRFEDFTGRFVVHCHILFHEDHGMMQLIEVVDPTARVPAVGGHDDHPR